jgi:type I restriction enzyme R subunit
MVSSEVIISGPDLRKGYESIDDEPLEEVTRFWNKMMSRHGNEKDYNESIVNQFKHSPEPEILIVVDKLLTGFDAPLNTVLYICRVLREHTLLQAIARVNRLFDGKDFGYIVDYANVLGELDEALGIYSAFEGFDQADVLDALGGIDKKVNDLPQKHSALWDLFKTIGNTDDLEEFELFLYDQEKRDRFYELLLEFAKAMSIAVSSVKFMDEVDERIMGRYKADLRRFEGLRKSVKLRYGDAVNYKEYEPKIKKLLDIHIQAYEVTSLNDPVNIFDDDAISVVKENRGIYGNKKTTGNIADTIASETKKIANERMGQDPAFYRKFSTLIQNAIEDHKAKRLSDLEYLNTVTALKDQVLNRVHDGLPSQLTGKEDAVAFYGVLKPFVTEAVYDFGDGVIDVESVAADTAVAIGDILERHSKVHFWKDKDAQNLVVNEIDDFLFDHLKRDKGIELSGEQMDRIIEDVLKVAKHRSEA